MKLINHYFSFLYVICLLTIVTGVTSCSNIMQDQLVGTEWVYAFDDTQFTLNFDDKEQVQLTYSVKGFFEKYTTDKAHYTLKKSNFTTHISWYFLDYFNEGGIAYEGEILDNKMVLIAKPTGSEESWTEIYYKR